MDVDGGSGSGSGSGSNDNETGGRIWMSSKPGYEDYRVGERSLHEDGIMDTELEGSVSFAQSTEYRTYRRRWIGLCALTLMNIIVSWNVRHTQPRSLASKPKPCRTSLSIAFPCRGAYMLTYAITLMVISGSHSHLLPISQLHTTASPNRLSTGSA